MDIQNVKFTLIDLKEPLIDAWRNVFNKDDNFEFIKGDIFSFKPLDCGGLIALVSPANSFGYMDGGIDEVYTDEFGEDLQKNLQKIINEKKYGELVVGDALIMPIHDTYQGKIPIDLLISAPTMRHPSVVKN